MQGRLAGLACNLPEQLHDLMLTGPCAGGTECGPVTRRDMIELFPAATVRSVLAVEPVSHVSCFCSRCCVDTRCVVLHKPIRLTKPSIIPSSSIRSLCAG